MFCCFEDSSKPDEVVDLGDLSQETPWKAAEICIFKKQYQKAVDFLVSLPEDPEAVAVLGAFYEHGLGGLPIDYKKAFEHFQKAAEGGSLLGQIGLQALCRDGAPQVPQDPETDAKMISALKARPESDFQWLKTAAEVQKIPFAGLYLFRANDCGAITHPRGRPQTWLLTGDGNLAQSNYLYACRMIVRGEGEIPEFARLIVAMLNRAAETGYGPALVTIGMMREKGKMYPQHVNIAIELYRKAALAGWSNGMYHLARHCEGEEAKHWLTEASKLDHAQAINKLKDMN